MKFAYFTLISKEWFQGGVALVKSLRKVSKYPIEVLMLDDISEENANQLRSLGAKCTYVDKIGCKISRPQKWHIIPEFYQNCFAKLHIWNNDYQKVIYLDADMIVLKNIDHLFYLEADFAAVRGTATIIDTVMKTSHSFITDESFNSGLLVITPDPFVFEDLTIKKDIIHTEEGLDQGFLNEYFKSKWYRLPQIYNATRRLSLVLPDYWNEIFNDICVLHYTLEKPWHGEAVKGCEKIEKIWWDYFISE